MLLSIMVRNYQGELEATRYGPLDSDTYAHLLTWLLLLAAALTFPPKFEDPFTVPAESFEQDLAVNVSSAYVALRRAVQGFQTVKARSPEDKNEVPFVFIATGNVTPFQPSPVAMTLGSGKAALAYLISVGAEAYKAAGFR